MVSFSTLLGVSLGVIVLGWGMFSATENPVIYMDLPSLAIVLGGTITAAFVGFRARYMSSAILSVLGIFVRQKVGPKTLVKDVGNILEWNKKIQAEGKAVSDKISEETKKDDFVKYLLGLLSTGYNSDEIRDMAQTSIEETYFRKLSQSQILNTMAGSAPAFGMIGTLIGLIAMLAKMGDPSSMGPALSLALITTFYGVLVARFVFQPAFTKNKQKLSIQRFREYLLLEGVCLIAEKKSSFYIKDKLNSYLDRKVQFNSEE